MRRTRVLSAVALLASCQPMMKWYEVGELPEERVAKPVKAIAAGLEAGDLEQCLTGIAADFREPAFDAGTWDVTTSPDGITVRTWRPSTPREAGREDLRAWLAEYLESWRLVERALAKIRGIAFDEDETTARGRFYLDVYGLSAGGEAREDVLHLEGVFVRAGDDWRIRSLRLDPPCTSSQAPRPLFRNVSREANASWPHEPHPQARGYLPLPEQTADCGLACGDYDGDGWYDVYLCNGRANRLLRNRGDGTFEDATDRAGLAGETGESRSALLADFDNDGDADLYVGNNRTPCQIWRNNGDGTFTDATQGSGIEWEGFATSCAAADYDRDGLLDIYQCNYGNFYEEFPIPPVRTGQPNRLYHNLGGLKFEEVADEAGVDDTGWTLACAWGDPNNDGWPDLIVANDFGDKCVFINDREGGFDDIAEEAGCLDRNFGMSVALGDMDGDGDFDMYFSNMYSNTNWIFRRRELLPMPWFLWWFQDMILGTLDEMTKGNSLFVNNGDGTFRNVTIEAGVDYGQWAWASEFLDYDADGDLDLYCLNGFISGTDAEDL
jgi:hypothetical protein